MNIPTEKKCNACGLTKSMDEFRNNPTGRHGKYSLCKPCQASVQKQNRIDNAERYKAYEKARSQKPERLSAQKEYNTKARLANIEKYRATVNESTKRYRQEYPEIKEAHRLVAKAVRDGVLVKPEKCENCPIVPASHDLHAHHHDYTKPLDVQWWCRQCHKDHHRIEKQLREPAVDHTLIPKPTYETTTLWKNEVFKTPQQKVTITSYRLDKHLTITDADTVVFTIQIPKKIVAMMITEYHSRLDNPAAHSVSSYIMSYDAEAKKTVYKGSLTIGIDDRTRPYFKVVLANSTTEYLVMLDLKNRDILSLEKMNEAIREFIAAIPTRYDVLV